MVMPSPTPMLYEQHSPTPQEERSARALELTAHMIRLNQVWVCV